MFPRSVATHGFLNSPKATASIRGRLVRIAVSNFTTWEDLILSARIMLDDEGLNNCPFRYPDSMLLSGLNRGLQELARIRPDSMYDKYAGNSLNVPEISDVVGAGLTFWEDDYDLDFRFWPALAYYIQGTTELSEDEYSRGLNRNPHSGRAATTLRMFRRHVLSV